MAKPGASSLNNLDGVATLDDDKRIWLAGFTTLQLVRTRAYSERSQDMVQQVAHAVSKINGGVVPEKIREQLGLTSPEPEREKVLKTILGSVPPVLEKLLEKSLLLYRTDGSLPFWISDNPVALNNTINRGDGFRGTLWRGRPRYRNLSPNQQ